MAPRFGQPPLFSPHLAPCPPLPPASSCFHGGHHDLCEAALAGSGAAAPDGAGAPGGPGAHAPPRLRRRRWWWQGARGGSQRHEPARARLHAQEVLKILSSRRIGSCSFKVFLGRYYSFSNS